jgi:hypothetical protein
MRYFLLPLLLISMMCSSIAQTNEPTGEKSHLDKIFHSLGTSVYMDLFNGPITERYSTVTDPFGNTTSQYSYERVFGYNYITLIYNCRYNLREINKEVSFGLNASPAMGIFLGGSNPVPVEGGIPVGYSASFNFPIMAGIHIGAAATKESSSGVGVYLGTGYEFNAAPLVYAKTLKNKDVVTRWFNPCLSLGLRYEGNNYLGNLQEINFKMGFGLAGIDLREPNNLGGQPYIFTKPFTFRISYFTYLNY